MEKPNWTVLYNIVSAEGAAFVGTGWEFFGDERKAHACYERHSAAGNVPTKRPYHAATDFQHLGAAHKWGVAAPLAPSDTQGAEGLLAAARGEIERLKEELFHFTRTENPAVQCPDRHYAPEGLFPNSIQQAPDAVRDASGLISATEILISHCEREYPGAHMTPALLEARSAVARAKLAEHNKGE